MTQPVGHQQSTCRACGGALPAGSRFCPHCGAEQSEGGTPAPQGARRSRSAGALFGIGIAVALVIGALSFGITRMAIPEPSAQPPEQQAQQPAQQPAVSPELAELRQQMRDSLLADPDNAGLTLRFANLLYDIGEYESAADFYNRYIVRFDSTSADAYVDYGHTLFRLGKHEEALAMTRRALEFTPNHAAALYNLGVMSYQMQDVEGARTWFRRVVEAAPGTELATQAEKILTSLSSSN